MIIAFIGGLRGLTEPQKETLRQELPNMEKVRGFKEFHHGGSISADVEAHEIAASLTTLRIVLHPHSDDRYRVDLTASEVREPQPALQRWLYMIQDCDVLLVCEATRSDELQNEVWGMIRYAERIGKQVVLIRTDGVVELRGDERNWSSDRPSRTALELLYGHSDEIDGPVHLA